MREKIKEEKNVKEKHFCLLIFIALNFNFSFNISLSFPYKFQISS